MKILITGAYGFVGVNLCKHLTEKGHKTLQDRLVLTMNYILNRQM
jgi:nucleoside-diphosphate-sugar epimerase